MKLKVLVSAAFWLVLITLTHLWLNVGFSKLSHKVQVSLGNERAELVVGFLPVT